MTDASHIVGDCRVIRMKGGWMVEPAVTAAEKLIAAGFHPESRGVASALPEGVVYVPDGQVADYVARFPAFGDVMR